MGNEGEILRGDQAMEIKKRKLASRNGLSHNINMLTVVGHCAYNSSVHPDHMWWRLRIEINKILLEFDEKKGALLFGKRAPNIFHVSQFGNGHMSRADSFAFPVLLLLDMEPLRAEAGMAPSVIIPPALHSICSTALLS
jgi:hypothetical protein